MTELTKRLKIPYNLFNSKPSTIIKGLLGNVKINSYKSNDFITDDDCVIVDVNYTDSTLSPFKIYFVSKADIKPITPNSKKYSANIEGNKVLIIIDNIDDYKVFIPLRVHTIDDMENYELFQYHGRIIKEPMNSLFSPMLVKCAFNVEQIEKKYPKDYNPKRKVEQMEMRYKYAMNKTPLLDGIQKVTSVTKYEDIKDNGEAYIINWYKLIEGREFLRGLVLIQPIREPFSVLFVPLAISTIEKDIIDSITEFLERDNINYLNFMYMNEQS